MEDIIKRKGLMLIEDIIEYLTNTLDYKVASKSKDMAYLEYFESSCIVKSRKDEFKNEYYKNGIFNSDSYEKILELHKNYIYATNDNFISINLREGLIQCRIQSYRHGTLFYGFLYSINDFINIMKSIKRPSY